MKFIFDNEEQKEKFMKLLGTEFDYCPDDFGLKEFPVLTESMDKCTHSTHDNCINCWEKSGLEIEVIDEKVQKNEVYIIDIPADGSYVEILGHKIYGKWKGKDGEDTFANFLDYLHRLKKCEERCERLKKFINDTVSVHHLAQGYVDAHLAPNDIRWLHDLVELSDHMTYNVNVGGKTYSTSKSNSPWTVTYNANGTAVGKDETDVRVELIPKEKWLAQRIIDLLEAIKFDVEHSIIVPKERIDELDSIGILFNACIKEMSKPSRKEFEYKGMV